MKPYNVLIYLAALGLPILYFTVLANNSNERQPVLVYVVCVLLMALAGWLTSSGFVTKARLKWTAVSVCIGIAEALALTLLF